MNDLLDIFPEIEKALKRKGVTKESVWRKYYDAHPDGYRETQFRNYYNQWSKHVNSSNYGNRKGEFYKPYFSVFRWRSHRCYHHFNY